jgi:hypothetical protein
MNKLLQIFMLAAFCTLFSFACSQQGLHWSFIHPISVPPMLEPGDQIGSMVVTTGANDAPPLWAFCSKSLEGKGSYILDCRAPVLASLGVGNIFLYADEAITNLDWSELVWELSIDGQKVDLESFGTFEYVVPSMKKNLHRFGKSSNKAQPGTSY